MKTPHIITRSQYLQLTGLLVLAQRHNDALRDIEKAMYGITQEKDHDGNPSECGHTADAVYGGYTAEELMGKIGITVEEKS